MTDTLADVLPELRRPFAAGAVKWKIQTNPTDRQPAMIVGFIDARLVAERLNAVCPGEWGHVFGPVQFGQGYAFATCRLTVLGQTREDLGWSSGVLQDMDAKTVTSDALKRAAVHFGIGAFLYAMGSITMWPRELEQTQGGKFRLGDNQINALRQRYAKWTSNPAIVKRFGEPLDHATDPVEGVTA